MPLTIGTRLGPYEMVSALGTGGMGEAYRACDTKPGPAGDLRRNHHPHLAEPTAPHHCPHFMPTIKTQWRSMLSIWAGIGSAPFRGWNVSTSASLGSTVIP